MPVTKAAELSKSGKSVCKLSLKREAGGAIILNIQACSDIQLFIDSLKDPSGNVANGYGLAVPKLRTEGTSGVPEGLLLTRWGAGMGGATGSVSSPNPFFPSQHNPDQANLSFLRHPSIVDGATFTLTPQIPVPRETLERFIVQFREGVKFMYRTYVSKFVMDFELFAHEVQP